MFKKLATIAYLHILTQGRQVARTTGFCLVTTNTFRSPVRKFLQVTIPVPRIFSFFLNLEKSTILPLLVHHLQSLSCLKILRCKSTRQLLP